MASVRRPYYQSQATQGVAIDWLSTTPAVPDYAAAISATCPATLPAGVVSCTIDGQGNTDYSFQLQIPAGTYTHFTVTTFDAPPAAGTFTGSMLAQGQLAAPVVIAAGTSNTIPSLTFYGVPATVSFVAAPAQSHVATYGGNLAVIGNLPQTFFAQAEDADGFLISSNDSGAPTITVAEAASDSPQHFTVGTTADANEFTLTAVDASANAVIDATATPGGTGLSAVTNALTVTPAQELWTTQEAGTNPNGIFGYAIYPGVVSPKGPIDEYEDPIGNPLCGGGGSSCNFFEAAVDPTSGVIYAVGSEDSIPQVYAFTQNAGSQGITAPAAAAYVEAAGANVEAMAIDTQHHGFIVDDNSGNVALEAYSTASSGWSAITSSTNASLTSDEAESVAVAPTAANVPSALVGTIWVGSNNGQMLVYPAFSGSSFGTPGTVNPGQSESVIGFDSAGYLWVSTGNTIYVYSVSGTAASPALTQVGTVSLVTPGAGGSSFGAAAGQHMWFGEGTGEYTGYDLYTASSCPSCSLSRSATDLATNSGSFAAFVTP
ncbi:MAG TPA: hypothetical protein VMF61_02890 [Candidatus Acidoferrales bacterium]|nr:hypothetical protein [Candidatus Acidoferrales bacterium]